MEVVMAIVGFAVFLALFERVLIWRGNQLAARETKGGDRE